MSSAPGPDRSGFADSEDARLRAENEALRARLAELEQRLAVAPPAPAPPRPAVPAVRLAPPSLARLMPGLSLLGALLLGAVPLAIVIQDRWRNNQTYGARVHDALCQFGLPCGLPVQFFLAVAVLLAAPGVVAAVWLGGAPRLSFRAAPLPLPPARPAAAGQRRLGLGLMAVAALAVVIDCLTALTGPRPPGWELLAGLALFWLGARLLAGPPPRCLPAERAARERWLAVGLFWLALIGLVFARDTGSQAAPVIGALLVLAAANLLRFARHLSIIQVVLVLALFAYSLFLNAWWFSIIGDEYSFHFYAEEIVQKQDWATINQKLFFGNAVYGAHPYISSLIQAASMWVFGTGGFGWRFSNVAVCLAALALLWAFWRVFLPAGTALLASVFLATSHYLMSFGKIGYNNLQALLAVALVLWTGGRAARSRHPADYVAAGLAMGFCFYVYPAALYAVPLPVCLFALYDWPRTRAALLRWGLAAVSGAALVFPLVIQEGYWRAKVAGTVFYSPTLAGTLNLLWDHAYTNLVYALGSFAVVPEDTHFVVLSYLDPVAAVLLYAGLAVTLLRLRRSRFAVFLLGSFAFEVFFVGVSHDRPFPPTTRMFMLLPWFGVFAALGLRWVYDQLLRLGLPLEVGRLAIAAALVASITLSFQLAYPLSEQRMAARYQSLEVVWHRTAERIFGGPDGNRRQVVFLNDPRTLHIDTLRKTTQIHGVPFYWNQIVEAVVAGPTIPANALPIVTDPNTFVVINPKVDAPWQEALARQLTQVGKLSCPVKNDVGDVRFTLWHPPGQEQGCSG